MSGRASPVERLRKPVLAVDRWQRRNRVAGPAYAVTKKFSDDDANLFVVALGWYGFTAIYPLLLAITAVLGYIGAEALGEKVVRTLHDFPVIGSQFNPGAGSSSLHGSPVGLIIGVAGLIYGAQGVTQTAEHAMSRVWNQPDAERPGFLPRLARSIGGLITIGGAFLVSAFVASIAAGHGQSVELRIVLLVALLVVNAGFYLASFRILTAVDVPLRLLVPGSIAGGASFTALITVGASLIQHQLRHSSATYGALGATIGVVAFLLILAKLTMYAAELNPVLARREWPRALPMGPPTEADDEALRRLAHAERRRPDERIGVGFGADAEEEAAADAEKTDAHEDEPAARH
jgi:uncharacterized BrkB/YihY/UPF0761 family membrane protein